MPMISFLSGSTWFRRRSNFVCDSTDCRPMSVRSWGVNCERTLMAPRLFLVLTCLVATVTSQPRQPGFPDVVDVSRDRPVTSHPSSAVCGLPTVDAFCRSTTSVMSVRGCLMASCTGECPGRTASPAYVDLLMSARLASCVIPDYVNTSPGSAPRTFSVLFLRSVAESNPTTCYVTPPVNPVTGSDGSFSLTFWIWLESNSTGFVCAPHRI